jgi:ATP-binding cassette subfamily B protein
MSIKQVDEKKVETETPKEFKKTGIRLFKLLIEQKTRFAVIIASAICFAALMAITPLILGWGLDAIITLIRTQQITMENLFAALIQPVVWLFIAWCGVSLFSLLQEYTMASVAETLTLRLRTKLTEKLNHLPMKFFDQYKTGDILTRATLDLDKVSEVLQVGLMQMISAILSIVIGLGVMIYLSHHLISESISYKPFSSQKSRVFFRKSSGFGRCRDQGRRELFRKFTDQGLQSSASNS